MSDCEEEAKSQSPPPAPDIIVGEDNNQSHSQPPSPQPLPQITLTKANDNQPESSAHSQNRHQEKHQRQPSSPKFNITASPDRQQHQQQQSPNSLSPILNRPQKNASPPPLPLTRDLLQRKNTLDKLLHENSKKRKSSQSQQQQQPLSPSPLIMTFGADSNILLDERVTAGLGISTPSPQQTSQPPSPTFATTGTDTLHNNTTSNLRHRRHQHRPSLMTSATAIMDNGANRKSPPPSPLEPHPHYKWNYDFDFKNLSPNINNNNNTSVQEPMMFYSGSIGATSNTGSSVYNNTNSKKMSPPSDYDDEKKHHQSHYQYHYPSPPSSLPPPYSRYSTTSYPDDLIYQQRTARKFLQHIFDAAAQVVNLRGCEQADKLLEDSSMDRPTTTYYPYNNQSQRKNATSINTDRNNNKEDAEGSQQPYDISPQQNSRPLNIPSTPLEKQSTNSRAGSLFAESISRFDKRSLFSDLPSATRHTSHNTTAQIMDQQSLSSQERQPQPHQKQNIIRFPSSPLAGSSLFFLPPDNSIRFSIWNNLLCSRYLETFLMFIILLHYVLICVPIYENEEKTIFGGQWTHYLILCIQCIYTYVIS
ncbi:hypothetical protein BDC45DRAFT_188025 [Circinella umbellata]|nr:hypothetical protein BDC45DRAFT_188025 [Circinella umbellata]